MAVAVGEAVYWAHRFRRALILSPLVGLGVAVGAQLIHSWSHVEAMLLHLI
ncbi:hypothetical protein [Brevundimonas sp. SORGH_AS_0993]|uniref:hypothetical protein n=1 Tax=Brevundimonas sp. SORGH_AS_0993 TaxID=3041794 RepID=UPI0027D773AF|nr:hypothetical protein [Brevundimonas sp. SORGH_AS_0993]